jgi:hypothetical protein
MPNQVRLLFPFFVAYKKKFQRKKCEEIIFTTANSHVSIKIQLETAAFYRAVMVEQ